jgi:hypothetical protein
MDHPEGARETGDGRLGFDRRVRLKFCGTQLSSDGGLLVMRELDDALGLSGLASAALCDSRRGKPDDRTHGQSRAEEPMPLTAHLAGRCIEIDRIFFDLPFAAMIPLAIVQNNAARFRPDIDRAGNFATTGPGNATAYL